MEIKLILWGMGKDYNSHVNIFKLWERLNIIKVIGVTARDLPNIQSVDGWRAIASSDLQYLTFDYIVILNEKNEQSIIKTICDNGFSRDIIIPLRVMDIPYFDWEKYIEIKKSRISILANNCYGGMLCRTLGIECLSPFKNLSVDAEDMIHIVKNLKYYMNCELKYKEWRVDENSGKSCPVLWLDDTEIFFNHSGTIEGAKVDWDRRKKKINYNNFMLVIYTEKRSVVELFKSIDCKKLCFIPENLRTQDDEGYHIYSLMLYPWQKSFWETVNSNAGISSGGIMYQLLSVFDDNLIYRIKLKD